MMHNVHNRINCATQHVQEQGARNTSMRRNAGERVNEVNVTCPGVLHKPSAACQISDTFLRSLNAVGEAVEVAEG
jgi:hypothetical protein